MATVEDCAYEAVYRCSQKYYADFFVSTFHGEVLEKSRGSPGEVPGKSASYNGVTWFNKVIGSGRYLSLGRQQLVLKRGKIGNFDPD